MLPSSSKDLNYTFYAEHTTADGDTMLIMSMSDTHLNATIHLFLRKLSHITNSSDNLLDQLDPLSRIVLGDVYQKKINFDKNQVPYLLSRLNTYMSEAVLVRGMLDLLPAYRRAVGRSKQLVNPIPDTSDIILESADEDSYIF